MREYGNIRVKENPYSEIFYETFYHPKVDQVRDKTPHF